MMRNPASKETARKPNMREAILAAAEELFATNGFNAVSVRDIAQAAGANPGSVTYISRPRTACCWRSTGAIAGQ